MNRVVIVSPAPPFKGGISDSTINLYNYLSVDYSVKIISFSRLYPKILFPGKEQKSPGNYSDKNISNVIDSINPKSWVEAAKEITKYNPELVLFRYWNPFFAICFISIIKLIRRSLNNVKVLGICDNIFPHEKIYLQFFFARQFVSNLDAIITMSAKVSEDFNALSVNIKSTTLYHPLFDIYEEKIPHYDAKKELLIKKSKKVILFFGFIRGYKGFDIFIKVAKLLEDKRPDITFLVAGELYEKTNYYHDLIGSSKNIIWHDEYIPNNRIHYYFSASDLLLLPYKSITQSGVVSLALSYKCPVMISNVGSVGDIIKNGQNGIIVDSQLPESYAQRILNYFDSSEPKDLSHSIRNSCSRFGWSDFTKGIIDIYNEL